MDPMAQALGLKTYPYCRNEDFMLPSSSVPIKGHGLVEAPVTELHALPLPPPPPHKAVEQGEVEPLRQHPGGLPHVLVPYLRHGTGVRLEVVDDSRGV